MRRIYILLVLFSIPLLVSAQEFAEVNGLAYDADGNLLNGKYVTSVADKSLTEITYKDGLMNGTYVSYSKIGKVIEMGSYALGEKDGRWTKWNDEGIKISEVSFVQGRKDGKWQIWDSNGTLRCVLYYEEGRKTGTWQMFDEAGLLVKEENHDINF